LGTGREEQEQRRNRRRRWQDAHAQQHHLRQGLGVHAGSEIVYNLGGQFSQFVSDVGLDDEIGNNGSVAFQVYADNVKIYDSGTMNGGSASKSVTLDVSGKNTLKLVVNPMGDGNAFDHGDWANARLLSGGATSTQTTPPPSSGGTWLSDLTWASATNGWGAVEKDRSNGEMGTGDGRAIAIRGTTYTKGLGVHASADIRYNIGGKYTNFSSDLGLDNEVNGNGSVVFQVYLDGVLKYDSGTVRGSDAIKQLSLNVSGVNELRLVVKDAGDGNGFDHADWAGAKLA